jgi:hypothetical protein
MAMRVSPWLGLQQHPGIGAGSGTFGIFVVAISLLMIPNGTERASLASRACSDPRSAMVTWLAGNVP